MPEYQLVYMEPKYRTIQAKDMTDAQRQARMIFNDMNQGRADPATMLRIEIPGPSLEDEVIDYADAPLPA